VTVQVMEMAQGPGPGKVLKEHVQVTVQETATARVMARAREQGKVLELA
jgi:hypothetical protein